MRGTLNDIAHAAKTLRKAPVFTTVVILVLALGIGATSTIFTVLSAVLLRPLPFPDAERVVHPAWNGDAYLSADLTAAKFSFWKERTRAFSAFASWQPFLGRVGEVGKVSSARGLRVTHGFLDVLGVPSAVGRAFTPDEYAIGGPKVALVSKEFWEKYFGEEPDLAGRVLRLEEKVYTIVGILPETFVFPYQAHPVEIIIPVGLSVDPNDKAGNWPAIARVRHDLTTDQARADVASLNGAFRAAYPQQVGERDGGMTLATFDQLYVGPTIQAIWVLMGAVVLVLLIAGANAANLFLARALARREEMALRAALGATRTRIMRLVLAEGLLVSLSAAAIGILIAKWGANLLVTLAPVQVPRAASVGIDWRVVLFAGAMSLATTTIVGGAAAWPAARGRLSHVLRQSSRTTAGRTWLQHAFLSGQTALAMLLLVGAGLLVATWFNLRQVDPGFDPERLVAVQLPFRPLTYDTSQKIWKLERRVIEEVTRSGAVAFVAGASTLPLERGFNLPMSISGRAEFGGTVEWRAITPDYFQTLGVQLVVGRRFEESDDESSMKVGIINETFARRYFPGSNPIGQSIDLGRRGTSYRYPSLRGPTVIVGIVDDVRDVSLRTQPRQTIYVPQAQAADVMLSIRPTMPVFIARGVAPGANIEREFREAIRTADPSLPGPTVFPLAATVADSLARERFGAILVTLLASIALILTAFGLYSVLTYTVRQRRREIGVRMAMGAGKVEVLRLVIIQGLRPIVVGISLGLLGALALSRLLEAYLWGVAPRDPTTLAAVATGILGVALIACWVPAREAVAVNPVQTLNS